MFRRVSRCVRGSGPGWRVYPPRGYSAHTGRIPGRHKNGKYAAVTPARPVFQRHEAHAEGSDTAPTQKCRKNAKRECLIASPNRAPAETQRSGFGGKRTNDRERVLPLAAGRGIRRPLGRRPASHLSGLRRSRCPAKCTGRGMAPHPQAASVSAETLLPASSGAASKGDQSPFEEPPALRGDERNHFRKVIQHEKRYQIQHAHGIR